MFTRPPDLPDSVVADALAVGWDLVVDQMEYAPVGFGSHHWRISAGNRQWFITVDDLDARQRSTGDRRDDTAARLRAALGTARALRADGLDFVVAPQPTRTSDVAHRINDRYLAAVYEHIEGITHIWGPYESHGDRLAVLERLVAVHRSTALAHGIALVEDFTIPSRDQLSVALTDDRSDWGPGPFAERARQLLHRHAAALGIALARYDHLVNKVMQMPERFVVTHGEPHRANTINTTDGVALIDWDTALVAPPERDLWMLMNDDPQIASDYTTRTGVAIDTAAVRLYRLWWDLCEISLSIAEFRAPHVDSEDVRRAWEGLDTYLDPMRWEPPI